MALTDYEKTQFENLTANFAVEDASALRKMEKKDKATAMTFVALPSIHLILLVAAGLAVISCFAGRIAGNDQQMLMSGGIGLLLVMISMLIPESQNEPQVSADNE
jgi:hypothetical protein